MFPTITNDDHLRSLALAVAQNRVGPDDPIEDVLARECVDPHEFAKVMDNKTFKKYLNDYVKEFTVNGFSFAAKSRVLAEDAIQSVYHIAKDADQPAAARIKAVENLVNWGGLAPVMQVGAANGGAPAFHITFNLPDLKSAPENASIAVVNAPPPVFDVEFDEVTDETVGNAPKHAIKPPQDPSAGADPWANSFVNAL